jgi:hypothetical protein
MCPCLVASVYRWDGMSGCAVGMIGSVAPPVVRHRQQALDLITGVRQGLQKVHQTCLMRTVRVSLGGAGRARTPLTRRRTTIASNRLGRGDGGQGPIL